MNLGNTFKIDKGKRFLDESQDVFDPVLNPAKKYSAHPSIFNIKERRITTCPLFEMPLMKKY